MPVYEVVVEGKRFRIEVSRKEENSFEVKIDGKEVFDVEVKGKLEPEKPFELELGERIYAVTLNNVTRAKPFQVKVNDCRFMVEFKRPTYKARTVTTVPAVDAAVGKPPARVLTVPEGAVVAPMSGKIVSVKVKEGDAVKRGAVVCILEAMKMENEILAPKDGVVQEVNVSEGAAVSEGDILLVIG